MSEKPPKAKVGGRKPTRARGGKLTPRHGNGAGQGDGWGGPAKGKGSDVEDIRIPGASAEKRALSATKREREAAIAEEMRAKLLKLARSAEREETQLAAASKLLDRIEGQPIARQISATVDDVSNLSDDEIRERLARLGRGGTPSRRGAASTPKPH